MKKIGLLAVLAMAAGSVSATLVLSDAEWAGAYIYTNGAAGGLTGNGTLDSVVDGSGDGDVAIQVTVDAIHDSGSGFNYGTVYTMTDLAAPVAGDVFSVQLNNLGSYANVMLCAIVDGGTYVQNDGVLVVFDQAIGGTEPQLQIANFDLSGHASIESVGLIIFAPQTGVAGGPQATIAVPEPSTLGMVALMGGGILLIRRKFRN